MYTLRTVSKTKGTEENYSLGHRYTLIDAQRAQEEFERTREVCEWADAKSEKTYAFVVNHDGSKVFPIHEEYRNYIMTESGRTFAKIIKP